MRKATAVIMCSIMATSCLPAYADTLGQISVKSDIECSFSGEIYLIVADQEDNRKLIVLNSRNNYTSNLGNLNSGSYEIKEVHVYNTDDQSSPDRKEITTTDFTLEYGNLNITENNQSSEILFKLHSLEKEDNKKQEEKENTEVNNNVSENDTDIEEKKQIEQKEKEKEKWEKSVKRRQKIYFINFIIDAFLILGLGSIWFFKIRKRKKDKED